jgi:hypothetical protein
MHANPENSQLAAALASALRARRDLDSWLSRACLRPGYSERILGRQGCWFQQYGLSQFLDSWLKLVKLGITKPKIVMDVPGVITQLDRLMKIHYRLIRFAVIYFRVRKILIILQQTDRV